MGLLWHLHMYLLYFDGIHSLHLLLSSSHLAPFYFYLFWEATQLTQLKLHIGAWVRVYLQNQGQLGSGYVTDENVSPSLINYYCLHILREEQSPMSPSRTEFLPVFNPGLPPAPLHHYCSSTVICQSLACTCRLLVCVAEASSNHADAQGPCSPFKPKSSEQEEPHKEKEIHIECTSLAV